MSAWVPALVTGAASAIVAIAVAFLNARSQRQLRWLDSALAEKSADTAARRSYEYDARRRLYQEVNPQLFQLKEACEVSTRRLRRIINGDIVIAPPRHVIASAERLFAPLVLAQELRRHLTAVDLTLDDSVRAQYLVAKELLWTFHEGMEIAELGQGVSAYRAPGQSDKPRQHLTVAELQRLVDTLTVTENDGSRRPMMQSELDDRRADSRLVRAVKPLSRLFDGADPTTSPVLWGLLLAQISLMHVFMRLVDQRTGWLQGSVMPSDIACYRNRAQSSDQFEGQVKVARAYVEKRVGALLVP